MVIRVLVFEKSTWQTLTVNVTKSTKMICGAACLVTAIQAVFKDIV